MSEPLSSPSLSSASSSFDMPSPPTYDSDDEIVWSLSSSSISTGSSNDFVVLSRTLSPSNVPPETPSPDSVSESSVSDISSSVASLSLSDVSKSVQSLPSLSPSLPLMPSRVLNVDYPTPTATPTPRATIQSTPAPSPRDSRTQAQLDKERRKAAAHLAVMQKEIKSIAGALKSRRAKAQEAAVRAKEARAKAQVVAGKSSQTIKKEASAAAKATEKARKAQEKVRRTEQAVTGATKGLAKAAANAANAAKAASSTNPQVKEVSKAAAKIVQRAKKSPPATPKVATTSVGLGSKPVVDDSTSEKGDDPSSFDEASQFITSYINDPETAQTKSKVHRLALLQSIIVEFGVGTTSMLPRTITAAKALVKSTVFVNVQEYLTVRTQGQDALKRILLPSKKALIKDIRRTGPTPRTLVKQHGLQALLVLTH